MKKEMLIKVSMNNNNNSSCFAFLLHPFRRNHDNHSRALRIAVGMPGVETVSFEGEDKSKILVKGNGVDTVKLINELRQNMGFAEIEKLSDEETPQEDPDSSTPSYSSIPSYAVRVPPFEILELHPRHQEPDFCSIM